MRRSGVRLYVRSGVLRRKIPSYAGGDPVNYADPFGDSLRIIGSDAFRSDSDAVRRDSAANAIFSLLEKSTLNFAIVEGDYIAHIASGLSFDAEATDFVMTPEIRDLCPTCRGISVVDPYKSAQNNRTEGMVALHEGIHLSGIVRRGRMYSDARQDCKYFKPEIQAGMALGRRIDRGVAARCM